MLDVFYVHISFDFYSTYFFIRAVSYGGVCKITGCNLSFISLNDGMCLSLFLNQNVEAYCFVKMPVGICSNMSSPFVKSLYHFISD